MMQPSESVLRKYPTRGSGTCPAVRCSLHEPEMRAVFVVAANIFEGQSLQVAFIECNDVIQQVTTATANPALGGAILPVTFEGRSHRTYLQESNGRGYFRPGLRIPVEDQLQTRATAACT
jgi:hypothetical protein